MNYLVCVTFWPGLAPSETVHLANMVTVSTELFPTMSTWPRLVDRNSSTRDLFAFGKFFVQGKSPLAQS